MKIIFLDIDGVLVNQAALLAGRGPDGNVRFAPECVRALNAITDATGAAFVISSNWRRFNQDMPAILAANDVKGEIVGQTPDLAHERPSGIAIGVERGHEIKAWMGHLWQPERFIILDDEADMGELLPRLVQTNYVTGLTDSDAQRAIAMLSFPAASPPPAQRDDKA